MISISLRKLFQFPQLVLAVIYPLCISHNAPWLEVNIRVRRYLYIEKDSKERLRSTSISMNYLLCFFYSVWLKTRICKQNIFLLRVILLLSKDATEYVMCTFIRYRSIKLFNLIWLLPRLIRLGCFSSRLMHLAPFFSRTLCLLRDNQYLCVYSYVAVHTR